MDEVFHVLAVTCLRELELFYLEQGEPGQVGPPQVQVRGGGLLQDTGARWPGGQVAR